jgi:hypothetical protein
MLALGAILVEEDAMGAWLEECIAERELVGAKPKSRPLYLRVGKPRPLRGGNWECRYEIRRLRPPRRARAYGVDALQALALALQLARQDLERLCPWAKWLDEPASRGLPMQAPILLPRKYEKRIEATIERATNRFYREMKRRDDLGGS